MIARVWRGWTTPADSDAYELLLQTEIFPSIRECARGGLSDIDLLRRNDGELVEFLTILWFDSMASIEQFAGSQPERAFVPRSAQALLEAFDDLARHYEIRTRQ